jgi:hypothetical protein
MGAVNIKGSINPFQPLCFAKARSGYVFAVNGLERGLQWNQIDSSAQDIGIDAPSTAPVVSSSGSGSIDGTYVAAYRYKEVDGAITTYGNITALTTFVASSDSAVGWSGIKQPSSTHTRPTHIELFRSTAGQSTTLYLVTTLTATAGGADATYASDTETDAQLIDNTSLAVNLPDGSLNARRFGVPPDYCPFIAQFQDRMFYGGRVKYTEGTVTTAGSTTITGSGTAWTSEMAGRYIIIEDETAPLLISSASATSITTSSAAGTSGAGKSYVIVPDPTTRNQLYFSEADEPESVPSINTITIQENTGDEDEITGLMPYGSALYVLKERHVYSLTFVRQPIIDAAVHLVASRGCVNNRSWVYHEGMAYLLDEQGVYRFNGYKAEPISEPIQDLFRGTTLDWSNKKWFFAAVDPVRHLIFFHVGFTADGSTRPQKSLVYNTRNETWSVDEYCWELGGACVSRISGQARLLLGSQNDTVLAYSGTSDMVTGVRGTATDATSTTLSDTSQSWDTDAYADTPIGIVSGTGKGQLRCVVTNTATQLNINSAWTTTPDSTSVYMLGAIEWNMKSGLLSFARVEEQNKRSIRLTYQPTTAANILTAQLYQNHDSSPLDMRVDQDRGTGITTVASSPQICFDLQAARSSLQTDPGFKEFEFSGLTDDRGQAARWMAVELSGFQGTEQIALYSLAVDGASS